MGWGVSPLSTLHAQIVYTACTCTTCTPCTVYMHHIHTRYSIRALYAHNTCIAHIMHYMYTVRYRLNVSLQHSHVELNCQRDGFRRWAL